MTQQIINTGTLTNNSESLRPAFDAVNNNFSQLWAAGPVDSNVVIANNVISTTPVNTSLILAPAGMANVQANARIVPGISGVYDLGAQDKRWDSIYGDYFYGNGFFLTGIQVANVGSLVNGNSNVAIDGPGGNITVNVNGVPNVVTFTRSQASVNGNVVASGNITANYFIGDGSLLTNIVATAGASIDNGNSNVRISGDAANVAVSVSGVGNVAVFSPTGLQVANTVTSGSVTALGNIVAVNFAGNGAALTSITGANVTGNVPKATYAYTAAQAGLAGTANIVVDNAQPNITSVGTLGNLRVAGNINALSNVVTTANVLASYFIGNGRHLTGVLSTGAKNIANGTSNISITQSDGPITVGVSNVSNTVVFTSSGTSFSTDVGVSGNLTTGSILTDNYYYANGQPLDMQEPSGSNTQIQFNDNGNFGASANLTFDAGNSILSVNGTVDTGNIVVSGGISAVGNVTADYFIGSFVGNITGNISVPGANTQVIYNNNGLAAASSAFAFDQNSNVLTVDGTFTAAGNVVADTFVGNGAGLTNTLVDRGTDINDWNALTQMGVYTVNRSSWSGTNGTPLDSQVFIGLLEVKNSTGTTVEQSFYPGQVDLNDVKIQWTRNSWSGSWTPWVMMINGSQQINGGEFN